MERVATVMHPGVPNQRTAPHPFTCRYQPFGQVGIRRAEAAVVNGHGPVAYHGPTKGHDPTCGGVHR